MVLYVAGLYPVCCLVVLWLVTAGRRAGCVGERCLCHYRASTHLQTEEPCWKYQGNLFMLYLLSPSPGQCTNSSAFPSSAKRYQHRNTKGLKETAEVFSSEYFLYKSMFMAG